MVYLLSFLHVNFVGLQSRASQGLHLLQRWNDLRSDVHDHEATFQEEEPRESSFLRNTAAFS